MTIPKSFYALEDLAARWESSIHKVVDAAMVGDLQVLAGIEPVWCNQKRHGGLVRVNIADLLPLFRRTGPSEQVVSLRRIAPFDGGEWAYITDPVSGVLIRSADLLVRGEDAHGYAEAQGLVRHLHSSNGTSTRYDWDTMYAWLFRRIHEGGMPETQAAMIGEVQEWFIHHSPSGKIPEDSTIRKRIVLIWRMMQGAT